MRYIHRLARIVGMTLLLAVLIVSSLPAQQAHAVGEGWLTNYAYRKQITITGSTAGIQSNYPVQVRVHKPAALVYYNGQGDGTGSNYQIGMASATSYGSYGGFSAYAGNPVVTYDEAWDSSIVKDQWVMGIGNQFVMYFAGNYAGIGIAVSDDGYTWRKLAGNPVLSPLAGSWEKTYLCFPRVYDTEVVGAKRYRMLYSGYSVDTGVWGIGYAYSSDGFTWSRGAANPVIGAGTGFEAAGTLCQSNVVLDGGTYYFLYSGKNVSGLYQTGLAYFTDWEGTYSKYDNNPVMSRTTSAYQALTAQLTVGTATVTVADTSAFHDGEPVWIDAVGGNKQFNRVASIDSSTQITLEDNADYTFAVGTTLRGWMFGSVSPATLVYSNGTWVSTYTAYMAISDGIVAETTGIATSADLRNWSINYDDSPPVPYDYNGGTWDDASAENPNVVYEDFGPNVFVSGLTQDDFDDVRFTSSDGSTQLDYYKLNDYISGQYADFFVEVPSIAASPTTTIIYMYYGYASATDGSNGENTFAFFDDFPGAALSADWAEDTTPTVTVGSSEVSVTKAGAAWGGIRSASTISGQYDLYAKVKFDNGDSSYIGAAELLSFWTADAAVLQENVQQTRTYNDATGTTTSAGWSSITSYSRLKMEVRTSSVAYYQNATLRQTNSTNIPNESMYIRLGGYNSNKVYADWVFVVPQVSSPVTITGWAARESIYASVATYPATSVSGTTATINGNLTEVGGGVDIRGFDYGTTTGYGSSWTESGSFGVGTFERDLDSLTPSTVYHFRAKVHTGDGWTYGDDVAFTTTSSNTPTVVTGSAVSVTATTATLQGTLTGLGAYTPVYVSFEYGTSIMYGTSTPEQTKSAITGYSADITGLTEGTTYHFRAKVRYGASSYQYGVDQSFVAEASTTPTVTTGDAVDVANTTATLQGTLVDLGGYATVYVSFEYGLTGAYGATTAEATMTAPGGFNCDITSLTAGTLYHFAARVRYGSSDANGTDNTFTTASATAPTVTTGTASAIAISTATLQGTITSMGSYAIVATYFDYGLTTGYGGTTAQSSHAVAESITGPISNLLPGRVYHFRAVIVYAGAGSPDYGADAQFTTLNTEDFGADRGTGDAAPAASINHTIPDGVSDFIDNNPAAPLVDALVAAINSSGSGTTTVLQVWQGIAGLLILLVVVGSLLMFNHHQFISGVAGVALFWFFVSQEIYPWWTMFIAALWLVATVVIERTQSV